MTSATTTTTATTYLVHMRTGVSIMHTYFKSNQFSPFPFRNTHANNMLQPKGNQIKWIKLIDISIYDVNFYDQCERDILTITDPNSPFRVSEKW